MKGRLNRLDVNAVSVCRAPYYYYLRRVREVVSNNKHAPWALDYGGQLQAQVSTVAVAVAAVAVAVWAGFFLRTKHPRQQILNSTGTRSGLRLDFF